MTKDDARLQLNAAAILAGFTIKRIDNGLTHYLSPKAYRPQVRVIFKDDGSVLAFMGHGTLGAGDRHTRNIDEVVEYMTSIGEVAA